ncbi:MAG: hypothetical protein WC205_16480 [Opitutaceae bacterium]|jgi:hypothetical protein
MLKILFSDRRIWLLSLILALVALLTRRVIPAPVGFSLVIEGGYWITLLLVMMFGRAVWPVIRERWGRTAFGRLEVWVLIGILVVTGVWVAHERPGYKILADELLLSGTAMGMHYERKAAYPVRATDVQGSFQILARMMDKRPLLFPFLTATLHDLTGYRPENAFYLNIGLSMVFLWLVYLIGWRVARNRWGGVFLILLFAGLPLLAQQATGAGFELLNLLLLAGMALLMVYYLEHPDSAGLEALIFGTLLLASTRYESLFFLLPVAIVAFLGWWRGGKVILSWPLICSPVFLAPLLLQNRLFSEQSIIWQMAGQEGVTEPFGLQYCSVNLGHALSYFFDFSGYSTNSPLFAVLGLLAMPFMGLWIARVLRTKGAAGNELAWAMAGLSLFGVTGVYMLYFWGKFDDPIISRLSLPVHLLMALSVVVVGSLVFKTSKGWKILSLVAVGGLLFSSLPVMAKHAYRTIYSPGVEMQMRQTFLDRLPDRNVLIIDNDSFFWILQKMAATPAKQAAARKDALIYHMRNHSFQEMYVVQSLLVDDATGVMTVDPVDDLGPDFELETVSEHRVQTLLFQRISRITAIKDGDKTEVKPKAFIEPEHERRTSEELEKSRVLYMENWIKQLP